MSDKPVISKHTAGPWHLLRKTGTGKFLVVGPNDDQPGDRLIADCYADSAFDLGLPSTIEAAANARLIASAPDLLAVLREFCQDVQSGGPNIAEEWPDLYVTYQHAQASIAKAEGKGLRGARRRK